MESKASRSKSNPILTLIKRFESTGSAKQWTQISWASLTPLSWSHGWQLCCWYTNNFSCFQSRMLTRGLHIRREKCKLLSPANALQQPKPPLLLASFWRCAKFKLMAKRMLNCIQELSLLGLQPRGMNFSSSTRRVSLWGWLLIADDYDNLPGGTNGSDSGPCHISQDMKVDAPYG